MALTLSTRFTHITRKNWTTQSKRETVLGLSQSFLEYPFRMYGQMACNFTSSPTVFHSYQDNRRVIHVMKSSLQRNYFNGWDFHL